MKKALIVTTISGFLPQFEMNNVHILQELGYEVHYASNFENPVYEYDTDLFEQEGVIVHTIGISKSPLGVRANMRALRELVNLMKRERFDLIHCHNPMGGVIGRLAARLGNPEAKVLYTAHGFHFYKGASVWAWLFFYPAERLLGRLTDHIITINQEDYARAERFHLKRGGKVWLIPGVGLDTQRFIPRKGKKVEQKKRLGFPEDAFLIISAGELNKNKNHTAVIEAIRQLEDTEICYGICGRGKDEEQLRKLIVRDGLENRVKLLGYRKDMEQVLAAADLFLFPSKREGFGMAAVEAMASGVPLITSDCRGTREYMEDQITGYVCAKNTPESYCEAIKAMKAHPERRIQMEVKCREHSLLFGKEAAGQIMRQIYKEAVEAVR